MIHTEHRSDDSLVKHLSNFPAWLQTAIGVASCAVVAHYAPSLVNAAFFGKYSGMTNLLSLVIEASVLAFVSAIGILLKRPWIVTAVIVVVYVAYTTSLLVRMSAGSTRDFGWIPVAVQPAVSLVLNTWLLLRYRRWLAKVGR